MQLGAEDELHHIHDEPNVSIGARIQAEDVLIQKNGFNLRQLF